MLNFINRHKIVIIAVIVDIILYWILFCSGVIFPFINPDVGEYSKRITSFPRNGGQILVWMFIHLPTSFIIDIIPNYEKFMFLSVIQTGIIAYIIEKTIQLKK